MTTSQIKQNQIVTVTSTEQSFTLLGDRLPIETVIIQWVSGTFQATATEQVGPILDPTYTTFAAAINLPLTVGQTTQIRLKGSGVVNVSW